MTEHRFSHEEPVGAPFQHGSDTSRDAAIHVAKNIKQRRADAHLAIIRAGETGATWDELVERYGFSPTGNGRITELVELGLVVDSGRRRKTRSGSSATVWISVPAVTP